MVVDAESRSASESTHVGSEPVGPKHTSTTRVRPAHLRQLGIVEYDDAMRLQSQLVLARQQDKVPDQLLVASHPHVITLGRRADRGHILADEELRKRFGVKIFESVRGGDVTYHGPGQIVLYPILELPRARQDVVKYVRDLEEVMIRTLADFGIEGGRISGLSGAWVGDDKIGAIGVRMSRWVTSHGLAFNVATQLEYFDLIVPCGIRNHGVTSLQKLLGRPVDPEHVTSLLTTHFGEVFDLDIETRDFDLRSIQTIVYRRNPRLELLSIRRVPALGGFWQPVTGRIEMGETPIEAAAREVLEETGLGDGEGTVDNSADPSRELPEPAGASRKPIDLDYVHGFMLDPETFTSPEWPVPCFVREYSFALEVEADSRVELDPATHEDFCWLPPEEALELQAWPGNKEAIRRMQSLASSRLEATGVQIGQRD